MVSNALIYYVCVMWIVILMRKYLHNRLNMSCNDIPSAFEVLKDRKVQVEKTRKLLSLELEEKNVSVSRKVRCDLSFNSSS